MPENNASDIKRNVAVKVSVSEILEGEYVKEDGWTPNYVATRRGEVSRANIIGTVILKEENPGFENLVIDDSTGAISVRSFEKKGILKIPKIGELVLLIGRPREYNGEKYILAEILRPLKEKAWADVRKKELLSEFYEKSRMEKPEQDDEKDEAKAKEKEKMIPAKSEIIIPAQINPYETVLGLIKSLDQGFGVPYEEIILNLKNKDCEKIIQSLIEEGEIFEIRPGILKML